MVEFYARATPDFSRGNNGRNEERVLTSKFIGSKLQEKLKNSFFEYYFVICMELFDDKKKQTEKERWNVQT